MTGWPKAKVTSVRRLRAQFDLVCDHCESKLIEQGWPYIHIEGICRGKSYSVDYHTWCDKRLHTEPPRGWDDCLRDERAKLRKVLAGKPF
jgi:hypothetical protein